ncbi:hypothetical protein L0222_04985 [bacterium]|nr:hypothetical protein [bacterium]MCI0606572.1 hypothetical protein [bacterium]
MEVRAVAEYRIMLGASVDVVFCSADEKFRMDNSLAIALFVTLTGLSSGYLAFYTPLALLLLRQAENNRALLNLFQGE